MKKRTYIVKQEKGSNVWDAAYTVAETMFKKPDVDFADKNGWSDAGVFDISLTDRYWEVTIKVDERITLEEADYKFYVDDISSVIEIGLKEVYMIM